MAMVILGFRAKVSEPPKEKREKPIKSRIFVVKDAAEQYADLLRKNGHPTATVETVYGHDDI